MTLTGILAVRTISWGRILIILIDIFFVLVITLTGSPIVTTGAHVPPTFQVEWQTEDNSSVTHTLLRLRPAMVCAENITRGER
jgi:hypothetical protein